MDLEIITFVISVPILIPIKIPMPWFQCRGLQIALYSPCLSTNWQQKISILLTDTGFLKTQCEFKKKIQSKNVFYFVIIRFVFNLSIIKVYEETIIKDFTSLFILVFFIYKCIYIYICIYINALIYFVAKFWSLHGTLRFQQYIPCNKTADNGTSMRD